MSIAHNVLTFKNQTGIIQFMKSQKKAISLWLMASSLLMLVVFQFLWLKNSYEDEYHSFSRQSFSIFNTTVLSLRDSVFARNVTIIRKDTLKQPGVARLHEPAPPDPLHSDTVKNLRIQIETIEPLDSATDLLNPLASALPRMKGRKVFYINARNDTISIDTLTARYKTNLAASRIFLPFLIKNLNFEKDIDHMPRSLRPTRLNAPGEPARGPYSDSLVIQLRLEPQYNYQVVFPEIRAALIAEIAPQIFFSLFLTSVIAISFGMMYQSLKSQERLTNAKNDFISNVTHELKTPVATVSVALEALKSFQVLQNPERTMEYLEIARSELNRLSLMTDKILKTSSFEANGLSIVKEIVDMDNILREVIAATRLAFEKNNVRVNYTSTGSNFKVMGNEMHLTNIAYNLLDNALKYGGTNSVLDITLKETETAIEFTVTDHGIGIPAEYHKKIFEKFVRVPMGDIHNVKGYGLGLNYVASVVKNHGGKINLVSNVGKGSSFKIVLPK